MDISKLRRYSPFFIADHRGNVLMHSLDLDGALLRRCLESLQSFQWSSSLEDVAFQTLDTEWVIRIQPVSRSPEPNFAIFIEARRCRIDLAGARRRYGLTKREAELLFLVMCVRTTSEIATELCISAATVGDHIASLLRKTGTRSRAQLVSMMLNLETDLAFIQKSG